MIYINMLSVSSCVNKTIAFIDKSLVCNSYNKYSKMDPLGAQNAPKTWQFYWACSSVVRNYTTPLLLPSPSIDLSGIQFFTEMNELYNLKESVKIITLSWNTGIRFTASTLHKTTAVVSWKNTLNWILWEHRMHPRHENNRLC